MQFQEYECVEPSTYWFGDLKKFLSQEILGMQA